MQLRRSPRVPRHLSWIAVQVGQIPAEWRDYLEPFEEAFAVSA
jgi:hypothetical protein